MKYKHLVAGGTFDLLHRGHEAFLVEAFKNALKVTIGLTSDGMASYKGNLFEKYRVRRNRIEGFLKEKKFKNWQIVKIHESLGVAISETTLDAILVSSETMTRVRGINAQREKLNLKPLEIFKIEMIAADDGIRISTGRIKDGEINREGLSFYKLLMQNNRYVLPENMRATLSKPLGELHRDVGDFLARQKNPIRLYVIGDYSAAKFLEAGIVPILSIVDFRIQRKNVYKNLEELGFVKDTSFQTVNNRAGEITRELIEAIHKDIDGEGKIIKVNGEEDLAVLPTVLLASLGSTVIYGLRGQGFVAVKVSEKTKSKFLSYLSLFE